MKEINIIVPYGIQYISDWKEYVLPKGHCIVDKGVTGCGYTEYCLCNSENVILCSPRKLLLENKRDQHISDLNILYLENTIDNYQDTKNIELKIQNHIHNCKYVLGNLPIKFMVTYDSAKYLVKYLYKNNLLDDFYFIVDEFQSIFLDSYFKPEIEFDFIEDLQVCKNVLYLSATPMLKKYLNLLDEFKDLDYYYIDWTKTNIVEGIKILRKHVSSLIGECSNVIKQYKSGKFPIVLDKNGKPIQSKEAVFYLNSVGDIIKIIKKNNLTVDEVNIICSDQPENENKLKKIGHQIGKIPLPGEPNKMFTFCTRSAYIGADFYSNNAKSYVCADPNIKCLSTDVSLDLPQIVGRQRDRQNPFKNEITLFYKTIRNNETISLEKFNEIQEIRRQETDALLKAFNSLTEKSQREAFLRKLKKDVDKSHYEDDFVGISSKTNLPVYNKFIDIANERAWEVSQEDYQDNISVTKALEDISNEVLVYRNDIELLASDFLDNYFYGTGIFREKMKMYCDFMDKNFDYSKELSEIIYHKINDDRFHKFYTCFGSKGCKAVGYEEKPLMERLFGLALDDKYVEAVLLAFKEGDNFLKKDIKTVLQHINKALGISKTAKATDLERFFKLTRTNILNKNTGKKEPGFRLDSLC